MSLIPLKIDYLLVGQGLAGTLLARLLIQAGKKVHLIDAAHHGSSTKVAAGIINPVTGRRYAKSWLFHELFPVAKKMYRSIEEETGLAIRVLINAEQENEWHSRSAWPEMKGHMEGPPDNFPCQNNFKGVFSLGTTLGAAQVNISQLITFYKEKWQQAGLLSHRKFDYNKLTLQPDSVEYEELQAESIIFCEGHQVINNPWFSYLPWNLSKGEVLHLQIPGYDTNYLLKHHMIYAPIAPETYWVGSNYEWNSTDDQPSEAGKNWLLKRIHKDLAVDFTILKHQAAIRPTVVDRRPLIGRHPNHSHLLLFNGLGTKGTSLGPYFAEELVQHLLTGSSLTSEADLRRFDPA